MRHRLQRFLPSKRVGCWATRAPSKGRRDSAAQGGGGRGLEATTPSAGGSTRNGCNTQGNKGGGPSGPTGVPFRGRASREQGEPKARGDRLPAWTKPGSPPPCSVPLLSGVVTFDAQVLLCNWMCAHSTVKAHERLPPQLPGQGAAQRKPSGARGEFMASA